MHTKFGQNWPLGASQLMHTTIKVLVTRVMHNKFGQNWVTIHVYDNVNLDPKTRNLFLNGPFRFVYNLASACPEVSKYLNS